MIHAANGTLGGKLHQIVIPAQSRRVHSQSRLIGPGIGRQFDRAVGMAVDVAGKTGHPRAGLDGDTMRRLVVPGGGRRPQQFLQALHLFAGEQPVKNFVIVGQRDFAAFAYVTQFLVRRQKERWRKLRKVFIRHIKIDVHALVLRMRPHPLIWKEHVGSRLQRMCKRLEGKEIFLVNFVAAQLRKILK